MTGTEPAAQAMDTTRPHPARVYDWFLGGKDDYPVDERLGRRIAEIDGGAPRAALTNRAFMRRATRALAAGTGVRQFLDISTGIPTEPNLHQPAQSVAPDARVDYLDNDPIVPAHAPALLRGTPQGVTEYLQVDARDPGAILEQTLAHARGSGIPSTSAMVRSTPLSLLPGARWRALRTTSGWALAMAKDHSAASSISRSLR